jgi:hypothetical protein
MYNKGQNMNVLIACEESQAVCLAYRKKGHNAFSCDLQGSSGGHPEWHFKGDVLEVIKNGGGCLENGDHWYLPEGEEWDLMIAHPPCTYLAASGAQWLYHPEDKHLPPEQRRPNPFYPNRAKDRDAAAEFFMALANAPIKRIAIENPVGVMSSRYRKPDQYIQPWMFGHEATKTTGLWLKNLPQLKPTNIVGKGDNYVSPTGKKMARWYYDSVKNARSPEERRSLRSKTFPGIADAFATQWSEFDD